MVPGERDVVGEQALRIVFDGLAMVVEVADGGDFGQCGNASDVIPVEVCDQQMIDAAEAGRDHGLGDALGIASAGEAGVDQQRFAGGADDERCRSAFHVDPVDIEGAGFLGSAGLAESGRGQGQNKDQIAKHAPTLTHALRYHRQVMIGAPVSAARPTRVRNGVIVFAVLLAVITYIDRVAISVAAPDIRKDLGLSQDQLGVVLSMFALSYALFEIPFGYLGDRLGPRRMLIRVVLSWSFFTAATGWAASYLQMRLVRFAFGAGEAGCFPNLTKVFTVWLPEKERVRAQGILWLCARWGGAFTPLLASPIIFYAGWRHAFEIFGVLGVLWTGAFYFWYREDPLTHPGMNDAEKALLRDGAALAGHKNVPWGRLVRSGRVWLLCWQYFFLSYGWYFNITWLPTYLRENRGMDITQAAIFGVLPLFIGGLGNPASLLLSKLVVRSNSVDRTRRIAASIGFAGACCFSIATTYIADARLAVVSIAMASFCNDLAMPPSWGAAMDMGGKFAGRSPAR
ncbi:MAG: MFS transporter [Acidobacteriota bacterium]